MSLAQLSPCTTTPPPNPDPSRPMLWRRISAPVSWVTDFALGQRGSGAFEVDAVDRHPLAVRLHHRPRLPGEAGDVGCAQLDVVEQHAPRDVAELVDADRRARPGLGEHVQRRPRCASDSSGARTSKPIEASIGPGRLMNSHASSWLSTT